MHNDCNMWSGPTKYSAPLVEIRFLEREEKTKNKLQETLYYLFLVGMD